MNETKYITEPGVHQMATLSDQGTAVFYLSLSLLSGLSYISSIPDFLTWVLGIPTQVLMLVWQDKLFPQVQLWNLFGLSLLLSNHVSEKWQFWLDRAWSCTHVNKIKPWWFYYTNPCRNWGIWDIVTKSAKIFAPSLCFIIRSLGS